MDTEILREIITLLSQTESDAKDLLWFWLTISVTTTLLKFGTILLFIVCAYKLLLRMVKSFVFSASLARKLDGSIELTCSERSFILYLVRKYKTERYEQ